MKLSPREAAGYFAKPDPRRTGLLIYGADAMRVALKRQQVIAALIGPEGDAEMRLTRIPAGELRRDGALLLDAIKAQGFFPGPRVAFVEDANQFTADPLKTALLEWREGDAQIVVTAGALKPTSPIRKLFEAHPNAFAAGIYDDPPSPAEIEANLAAAGLTKIAPEAREALAALAQALDPGDFRQTLEKVALYKFGDETPLTTEDVSACAPSSVEAGLDDILDIVAEGRAAAIGPVMARLQAQGVTPVTLCIGATRHFRSLHGAAMNPGGKIFSPRASVIAAQARRWGAARLEQALHLLTDTDLALRSAARAPQMAVMERTLIRLAMLGGR
ncbi:DNA polymerase III subunit delta [Oceaniglobus roseus]|uniref:DNA polymerase III subunit delta n=1 Tax=Oceaniglobus roseus TaxID=1737570 RepID=UPI000C7F31C9|nr:DNA polymerase III subunit delta [Kandeliimicrobium roseum]